jgi:hypothetical protein
MMKRLALMLPLAIACSDTGPSAAVRFDELYRQTCRLATDSSSVHGLPDPGNPNYSRCIVLAIVVSATASGAEPSSIQVGTASGTQTWQAIVVAEADTASDGSRIDSSFSLVAYDAHFSTAVVAQYAGAPDSFTNFGSAIYTSAPVTIRGSGGPVTFTTLSIGSQCRDVPGLTNPFGADTGNYMPIEFAPSVCHLATFDAQMSATFGTAAGLDSSFRTITIAPQSVNGIRVVNHPVAD